MYREWLSYGSDAKKITQKFTDGINAYIKYIKDNIVENFKLKNSNKPLSSNISINKLVFEEGRKHQIYFRTLGNIIMLVPPLDISQKDLNFLIDGTISTIKSLSRKL